MSKLPPFNVNMRISGPDGKMAPEFLRALNAFKKAIEKEFGALEAADAALAVGQAAQSTASTALSTAVTADGKADDAIAAVGGVASDSALVNSGTIGCTIVGTDAGASASVTVSGHTRAYGDGTQVAVDGGGVSGLDFSTQYWIYYLDPTRAGGAVTYQVTDDPATAIQTGDVHSVGSVSTPADGGANTDGSPNPAPGNVS